jgi:hypothetical protein
MANLRTWIAGWIGYVGVGRQAVKYDIPSPITTTTRGRSTAGRQRRVRSIANKDADIESEVAQTITIKSPAKR